MNYLTLHTKDNKSKIMGLGDMRALVLNISDLY